LSQRVKQRLINTADWWFAYTDRSLEVLVESGFPQNMITNVQNSIDDSILKLGMKNTSGKVIDQLKTELNITGDNVALYCGGMHRDKGITFLLDACYEIKKRVPDFEMIWIGSGPEQSIIQKACRNFTWMKYVGPIFGADRVKYFRVCHALLMPGPVGLVVIDSFNTGVPIITTNIRGHGPEISYIENGFNGMVSSYDLGEYAEVVSDYFCCLDKRKILRIGCLKSAEIYTEENMVRNFSTGIQACISKKLPR
jgi:glycosyltransferase involved in cell wall biosynthesis